MWVQVSQKRAKNKILTFDLEVTWDRLISSFGVIGYVIQHKIVVETKNSSIFLGTKLQNTHIFQPLTQNISKNKTLSLANFYTCCFLSYEATFGCNRIKKFNTLRMSAEKNKIRPEKGNLDLWPRPKLTTALLKH